MAVGADAEQDQVEPWNILGLEERPQLLFVGLSRLLRRQLAPDPVDVRDRNVVEGLSNAEIGRRIYLSESTIKQHLRAAYKLLGVSNRTEAANLFRRGV